MTKSVDCLIVGGGVVGLTIALETKRRDPSRGVAVIEKEAGFGEHSSTRNSGVLHAGFYYTADSHKARLTVEGNRRMTDYCLRRKLPINRCGKLVVARDEDELEGLDTLLERGRQNGVELELVSEREARIIEPAVRTHARALFAPTTASVDPRAVMNALVEDCRNAGIELHTETRYVRRAGGDVETSGGRWSVGFLINAAGLYADKIAHDYGVGEDYSILPFKGVFLVGGPTAPRLRVHVYPVPNLANPFLGVHFTVTVDGAVKIGPSAIPAFWREHYGGLKNFSLTEMAEVVRREAGLFLRNDFEFRSLARYELRKYNRKFLAGLGAELVQGIRPADFRTWGRAGIRAQLVNTTTREMVMDFVFERTEKSLHVLNAVSPAFTCCFSFASFAVDQAELSASAA